jgi:hypothetical protein
MQGLEHGACRLFCHVTLQPTTPALPGGRFNHSTTNPHRAPMLPEDMTVIDIRRQSFGRWQYRRMEFATSVHDRSIFFRNVSMGCPSCVEDSVAEFRYEKRQLCLPKECVSTRTWEWKWVEKSADKATVSRGLLFCQTRIRPTMPTK